LVNELRSKSAPAPIGQAAEASPELLGGMCDPTGQLEGKIQKMMVSNNATEIQFSSLGF
jgi:hypothetical protein